MDAVEACPDRYDCARFERYHAATGEVVLPIFEGGECQMRERSV